MNSKHQHGATRPTNYPKLKATAMQTNNTVFEKFSRSNKRTSKPTLATDSTRQCKKSIKLARKLARKNKRYDFEGAL